MVIGGVVMVPAEWRGVGRVTVGEEEMGKMGKETGNGGARGLEPEGSGGMIRKERWIHEFHVDFNKALNSRYQSSACPEVRLSSSAKHTQIHY
jgi:hypothetical protein